MFGLDQYIFSGFFFVQSSAPILWLSSWFQSVNFVKSSTASVPNAFANEFLQADPKVWERLIFDLIRRLSSCGCQPLHVVVVGFKVGPVQGLVCSVTNFMVNFNLELLLKTLDFEWHLINDKTQGIYILFGPFIPKRTILVIEHTFPSLEWMRCRSSQFSSSPCLDGLGWSWWKLKELLPSGA